MNDTPYMRADEIANSFNATTERQYWKAVLAGSRTDPIVRFNSRTAMVQVDYDPATGELEISFSKASVAFGDYLASAHRAVVQITAGMKATGAPWAAAPADEEGALRLEYDPYSKRAVVHLARHGDNWPDAEPLAFKVPHREIPETERNPLDAQKYGL